MAFLSKESKILIFSKCRWMWVTEMRNAIPWRGETSIINFSKKRS
jgi:hypothetical protein